MKEVIEVEDFVDLLLPHLTPYEAVMYLFLVRHSVPTEAGREVRIGQKRIAARLGRGAKAVKTNQEHIRRTILALERKGCLAIRDTNREGTLYAIFPSRVVPVVAQQLAQEMDAEGDDWFRNPAKRSEIFERDGWLCKYCGESVDETNAVLDHYVPQCDGGDDSPKNLKTSCLLCNSIKSGKTFEDAAPLLLRALQERRARTGRAMSDLGHR